MYQSPIAKSVFVTPLSVHDWLVLELNADFIQDTLLPQLYISFVNQVMTIWINASTFVHLRVGKKGFHLFINYNDVR